MGTGFWLLAASLGAAAAAFLILPLWRERERSGRWSTAGLIVSFATVPIAFAVYFNVSTWRAEEPSVQAPPEQVEMVARLAARMTESPEDVEGWLLLGRSYMVLSQYVLARQAYSEAWARTPVPDNELKLSYAEASILSDRASLAGEAGLLVEEVLEAEPGNPGALWYGGLVAMETGRQDAACTRWSALLASNPPAEVGDVLQSSIASLNCGPTAAAAPVLAASDDGPVITLNVRLGESRSIESLGPQAALFIFARAPGGGPPVAVIREPVGAVPGVFTLSDGNTMLPGTSLANFPELSLVARLSASGQPTEQSGDLYAEASYSAGTEATVELVIDRVVP